MSINKIDPNLANLGVKETDVEWISAHDTRFSLHGVFYDKDQGVYTRVPHDIAESVSKSVANLSYRLSGGRLRFVSDSPYIAIRASLPAFMPLANIPITASHGFSVYVDGHFVQKLSPAADAFFASGVDFSSPLKSRIFFAESKPTLDDWNPGEHLYEIYLPIFGGVAELYVGIKEGSVLNPAPKYKYEKPMLFYGSSIMQGAGVPRPGSDYASIISRWLDSDYINLGFSGSGNAEQEIIDYILSIDASLYAYDYNLYDDRPERILPPHYDIYRQIRDAHPDALILLYDKPAYEHDSTFERRRDIIRGTYDRALAEGDEKIVLVEATELFGDEDVGDCLSDCSHPNALGAMKMAEAMYNKIKDYFN